MPSAMMLLLLLCLCPAQAYQPGPRIHLASVPTQTSFHGADRAPPRCIHGPTRRQACGAGMQAQGTLGTGAAMQGQGVEARGDVGVALASLGRRLARLNAADAEPLKKLTVEQVVALSNVWPTAEGASQETAGQAATYGTPTAAGEAGRSAEAPAQTSASPLEYLKRALRKASERGDLEEVRQIAECCGGDAVLHGRDYFGQSALHLAAAEGHLDVVRFLAERGAAGLLGAAGMMERTALHQARDLEVQKFLAACGGRDLLVRADVCGYTALHLAAKLGNADAVRHLASCGGRELILATDKKHNSALLLAARANKLDVVRVLVEVGGRELLELKGHGTWEVERPVSPLEVALERKNFAVASYLEEQEARLRS